VDKKSGRAETEGARKNGGKKVTGGRKRKTASRNSVKKTKWCDKRNKGKAGGKQLMGEAGKETWSEQGKAQTTVPPNGCPPARGKKIGTQNDDWRAGL